jgi:membrane-associated phospholipid phosphatase
LSCLSVFRFDPAHASSCPRVAERLCFAAGIYAVFFVGYNLVNRLVPMAACRDLTSSWDRLVPFVPGFVWPFLLAYPLIGLPALLLPTRRDLHRAAVGMTLLIVLSLVLFVTFPVVVPRPTRLGSSFSAWLVDRFYALDRPVCGFPSLHVSTAVFSTLTLWRARVPGAWVYALASASVALSTLFVKQHVLADVLGGMAAAYLVHRLMLALLPERTGGG